MGIYMRTLLKIEKMLALTFSLLLGSSLASLPVKKPEPWLKEWDCQGCGQFSADLIGFATSESSITGQIEALLPLCDDTEDPAECQRVLPPLWTGIANGLWPGLFSTENMCGDLCKVSLMNPKEACAECMNALELIDEALLSVETEVFIVLWLDENFCPTQEIIDPQFCAEIMPTFIPTAMQILVNRPEEEVNDGHYFFCDEVHNAC